MSQPSLFFRLACSVSLAALLCLTIGLVGSKVSAAGKGMQPGQQNASTNNMADVQAMSIPGHMYMTPLRPLQPGDQQKADAIVAAAKKAMAPYTDYRKALANGYVIFQPNVPQSQYHFTNREYARQARRLFDPLKPSSLLYKKTEDGGYKLVGVMYIDRVDAGEEELNERIPLSIARWHQHVNICEAPVGQKAANFGPNAKFGFLGSITTRQACDAAGGEFHPHLFGWMVHIYPYETDSKKIWSMDDDSHGKGDMGASAMPGMKMN